MTGYDPSGQVGSSRGRWFSVKCSASPGSFLGKFCVHHNREINELSRQCLDRQNPDRETMISEVAALQDNRDVSLKPVTWRFLTEVARIKLKSLYPSIQRCQDTRHAQKLILVCPFRRNVSGAAGVTGVGSLPEDSVIRFHTRPGDARDPAMCHDHAS